jgi:transglutaminase-like putative cysteine protease
MQKSWYSINWNRCRLNKASQLALIIMLAFAGAPAFAGVPDWLKQVAQAPLPPFPDDTDAVVLLDERVTTVSPTGEVRTTFRKAFKILRPEGRTRGTVYVYFDNQTQLTFLKAWSITSQNEEYEVKEGDAVETAAFSESLYEDTRYKLLQIPASQPGNVIGFQYEQRQRPSVLQVVWSFQDEIPVQHARFILELPATWGYTAYWRNHAVMSPQQTGENRWTWELVNIAPIRSEKQMPNWRSVAGQVGFSFAAKASMSPDRNDNTWAQIGRWYAELTAGRREITPPIRDKARGIVAGATNPLEGIRRLAAYVQHSIRYVAIEIGLGGYQPHAAQEVLASGYGDCKDKATLLSAMLREVGIDSYYVLINHDRELLAPDFPSMLSFNHVILAIRLPKEELGPGMSPTLPHDKLGPLLLFDPTDDSTPFGYLPPSLQSNYGLLVTDAGGELVKLPLSPPSSNHLLRVATLSLDKFGNLKGRVQEVRTGPAATAMRERLLNLPNKQRQKVFQNLLADLLDGAVLTKAGVSDLKESNGSLSLSYDLTALGYAQHVGELFLFRSCVLGHKSSDLLEGTPRKQPIVFPYAASEGDLFDISFPDEYTLDEMPQTVKYEYPFAAYKSETRSSGHVLHYSRNYEIKDVRVLVDQLEDFKKLSRDIANDERAYTILKAPATAVPAQ